ncbi:predicted protein [Naegleria gruberi]|uniref:Predicted protein n=1 Tax=Naegleria gruberi TaxID=5762 RepID=D2VHG7_NAEGR|nr:uncharacterized protein NAEGRDRAFT_68321 [Naegleria gruberi]EFC43585.1 predicted protein [Naegleria gruberi]|eukprot:XP_002676329.1 predicted protein [Naegleria gruberi strain NEG-M]
MEDKSAIHNDNYQGSAVVLARLNKRSSSIVIGHQSSDDDISIDAEENRNSSPFYKSVKFSLLMLVGASVLLTVVLLTLIWIPTFSSSIYTLSEANRLKEFNSIVSFVSQTVREIVMVSESSKNLLKYDFNVSDVSVVERAMYQIYKSEQKFHKGLTYSTYIGDSFGNLVGIVDLNGKHMFVLVDSNNTQLFECVDIWKNDLCVRSQTPNTSAPRLDMSVVVERGTLFLNSPSFTLSYVDSRFPYTVYITLVNSVSKAEDASLGIPFSFYFGYDISTTRISNYLNSESSDIPNSLAYILESSTGNIISSSFNDFYYGTPNARSSITNFPGGGRNKYIAETILGNLNSNIRNLRCGEQLFLSPGDEYITAHRICLEENIDWIIVFAVKQWTYVSTMVVAIVVALVASTVVTIIGFIIGIFFSLKMVEPFDSLIAMVRSVSYMDFALPKIEPSFFSELSDLQQNFLLMISKIKSYRAFIPSHLLSELDAPNEKALVEDIQNKKPSGNLVRRLSSSKRLSQGALRKTMVFAQKDRFALGLEDRCISQVCIYIQGFKTITEDCDLKDIVFLLGEIYDSLIKTSKTTGGQIGLFENNLVTMSWNATKDQPKHELKALSTATSFLQKINIIKETRWRSYEVFRTFPKLLENIHFRVSVSSQLCQCGNIGTEEFKSFTILGSIQKNLFSLVNIAKQFNLGVLVTEDIHSACVTNFTMRYIENVDLAVDVRRARNNFAEPLKQKSTKLYEVGESTAVNIDEWMYELQEKEKKERWLNYNRATLSFFEKDYNEAITLMDEFLKKFPDDLPALHFKAKCYSYLGNISHVESLEVLRKNSFKDK